MRRAVCSGELVAPQKKHQLCILFLLCLAARGFLGKMAIVYHMLRKCARAAEALTPRSLFAFASSPFLLTTASPFPALPLASPAGAPALRASAPAGYIGRLTERLAASGLTYHDAIAETGVYEQAIGRLPAGMQADMARHAGEEKAAKAEKREGARARKLARQSGPG